MRGLASEMTALVIASVVVVLFTFLPIDERYVKAQLEETQRLIEGYERRVTDLNRQLLNAQISHAELEQKAQESLELSGLESMVDEGIVLVLGNGERPVQENDIWRVLNELCAGGAKAISIGPERMIAVSGVRQVGSTLAINKRIYSAPYVIRAIGDMQALVTALQLYGGVYDLLRSEIDIRIEASERVEIPAYVP
jgi:uncharacterized protein YlxW (UPF0749 family)